MEAIFRHDAYARRCQATVVAVDGRRIRLDRTVFYPTGGGQPGDSGSLQPVAGAAIPIVDALKGEEPEDVVHIAAQDAPLPPVGTVVTAAIDWQRRDRKSVV